MESNMTAEDKIQKEAFEVYPNALYLQEAFIKGAKSPAAEAYWREKIKNDGPAEKMVSAREINNWLYIQPDGHLLSRAFKERFDIERLNWKIMEESGDFPSEQAVFCAMSRPRPIQFVNGDPKVVDFGFHAGIFDSKEIALRMKNLIVIDQRLRPEHFKIIKNNGLTAIFYPIFE